MVLAFHASALAIFPRAGITFLPPPTLLRMTTTCVSRRADTPWSPVCVNPATGERVVLVNPPPGFVQVSNQLGGQQEAASALPSFQSLLVSQA